MTDEHYAPRFGRRRASAALIALPLAAAFSPSNASGQDARTAAPAIGARLQLPDFSLLEGGTFRAAEAEGKVVVVYWWASWCPFCAEMSPSIEKLWRTQCERGLTVLGISIDTRVEAALEYRRKRSYTFPSVAYTLSIEKQLPKPKAVPVTWVRGRDGRIVLAEAGQLFSEDVEAIARFI